MKRRTKLFFIFELTLALLLCVCAISVLAVTVGNGDCGEALRWILDDSGSMTIEGSGPMTNYVYLTSGNSAPWYTKKDSVRTVVIEKEAESIGDYAFSEFSNLTSVTIADSVTAIGSRAFYTCSGLQSISIPGSVKTIGDHAFHWCTALQSVTLLPGVTDIAEAAFQSCYALKSVTIPKSVTVIGDSAFCDCSVLSDVYYAGSRSEWNSIRIGPYNDSLTSAVIHFDAGTGTKEDFVTRLYAVCLDREPGEEEIAYYLWEINDHAMTGTEVAYKFIFADEFKAKNYCDRHYAEALYKAFMGREPSEEEINSKAYLLQQGQTREQVFNEFVTSSEYKSICAAAGIDPGNAISYSGKGTRAGGRCSVDGCHSADGMDAFNARLYNVVLDRQPAQNELDAWAFNLICGDHSAKSAAKSFLFSEEFKSRNYDDATFVGYLYEAMMDRTPAADEIAYWVWMLTDQGLSREAAFEQFAASDEFMVICAQCGIVCE